MIRHNSKTIAIALLLLLPTLLFGGTGVRATGSSLISTMPIHRFLQLNGTTQYAYVADNDILDVGMDDFAVSAWIYITLAGAQGIVSHNKTSGNSRWGFEIDSNGKLAFIVVDTGGTSVTVASANPVIYNTGWNHVFLVVDRSGSAYIWLNSAFNKSASVATLTQTITPNSNFYIGKSSFGSGLSLGGKIDEVRVYKFGVNGLYVDGTFGSSGIIRVGDATGDLIWSDANSENLIKRLYNSPYSTLTSLGYASIDNADRTERVTNTDLSGTGGAVGGGATGTVADLFNCWKSNGTVACSKDGSDYQVVDVTGTPTGQATLRNVINNISFVTGKYYVINCNVVSKTGAIYLHAQTNNFATQFSGFSTDLAVGLNSYVFKAIATGNGEASIRIKEGGAAVISLLECKQIGEVARWQLDTSLLDTNINGLNLTGVGSPAYGKAGLRAQ